MAKVRYTHDEKIHNTNSASLIVPTFIQTLQPKSVIDIGCGLGTWLKVFEQNGVEDYLGADGHYLNMDMVVCDKNKIKKVDLEKFQDFGRKFDLAITLEVAEHLSENSADNFVKTLVNVTDNIIFSAAIPNQGGMNHINEQWMNYWAEKFAKHNFKVYDVFRMQFWDNPNIEFWYKQNMYFITKNELPETFKNYEIPYNLIHQDLLEYKQNQLNGNLGVTQGLQIFLKSIKYTLNKFL